MEKYLAALVLSQQPTISSDSKHQNSTMKYYLENVRKIKSQLLNNLSICATSVSIQEQTQSTNPEMPDSTLLPREFGHIVGGS